MLEVIDLEVSYHKKQVIFGISLGVQEGELVTLVGPNGAGKTTTLNTIVGLVRAQKGIVRYKGKEIMHRKTCQNIRSGIALVPQGGRVFPDLTVLENLQLGGYTLNEMSQVTQGIERVWDLFPALKTRKNQMARLLSGGERQMLAVGRALILTPDLLLLDEPSLGLAPIVVKELMNTIKQINEEEGTTALVVEQNVREVFSIVERAYVMRVGRVVLESREPPALLRDAELRRSYLA
jgi:branched-chain amino acid transport system ATP-binding protein